MSVMQGLAFVAILAPIAFGAHQSATTGTLNRSYSCWLFISIPWGHAAFVGFGGRRQGPDERASLAQDLAAMRVRGILRQEIWTILREIGLVSEPEHHRHDPGPKRDQTRHLRLVEK